MVYNMHVGILFTIPFVELLSTVNEENERR